MFLSRFLAPIAVLCAMALAPILLPQGAPTPAPVAYYGFDSNDYPGDDALPVLRKTFSFAGYWLSPPPGAKSNSWEGKRTLMYAQGFGFLVLYNGRESRNLRDSAEAHDKGKFDADNVANSAQREGFPHGTVIFLDIEEGGRLPDAYHVYLRAWSDTLAQASYRAGVYCSAMPVDEGLGVSITTAQDIQAHIASPGLVYWVYNDACPPSPGCAFPANPPALSQSGFSAASIWQYAQSPRRKKFTAECPANYAADGNCYAPGDAQHRWFLDANVAASPDPSFGR